MAKQKLGKSKALRIILIIVGFISFGLGTVGIVIPGVLPTTPFYLLTSYCFVKSSERFNNWFMNSKLYHKYLENFATTRAMILRNELCLLLFVSAMLMLTIYFVNNLVVSIILTVLIALKYTYFVWRVKPISKPEYIKMMALRQAEAEKEKALEEQNKNLEIKEENKEVEKC